MMKPFVQRATACIASCMLIATALLLDTSTVQAGDWAAPLTSPQIGGLSGFAHRSDGTMFECKVNGNDPTASWTAISHGRPGSGLVGQVSAHFHSTNTDFYIFTRTASGNLYLRSAPSVFNNSSPSWSWTNLGKPASVSLISDPASVSYAGFEYAFVIDSDNHLRSVKGAPWVWSDHGTPAAGVGLIGRPTAITYADSLYVFVVGTDGILYLRTWNGIAWSWVSAGTPKGTTLLGSATAATRNNTIDVFVQADNLHWYLREWTGSMWTWSDQGLVSLGISASDAAWFVNQGGNAHLYAFALRITEAAPSQPKLLENHWDGVAWHLNSHSAPAQTLLFQQPAVVASFGGELETWPTWRVNVFAGATGDRIYRKVYSPIHGIWQWTWSSAFCQM